MPAGRPTDYKPEYCQGLIEHMASGLSFESYAAVIDVCEDTLYEWKQVHQEFSEAHKKAYSKNRYYWENIANQHLVLENSRECSTSFNTGVWIFNMKNRFKWRDKQPEEVTQVTTVVMDKETDAIKSRILSSINDK